MALLEQRHPKAIELGLERCGEVYRKLGSPRPAKTIFTVAGTNGKGSTVAYLSAINTRLGQRCGTYTSPHIRSFNERICIMGEPVSDDCLIRGFEQVEAVRDEVSLTYFEFTSLAAFLILQQSGLDCAVLEVGLGGRLDTVNLVDTDCAVITPIGFDHQDFLGSDLDSIAAEKAGVIRADTPVVCTQKQVPEPILQTAGNLQAPIYRRQIDFDLSNDENDGLRFTLGKYEFRVPRPPLSGNHQRDNLAAALAATVLLNPDCRQRTDEIAHAINDCKLTGRMQQLATSPDIFVDVGHNALAAEVVAAYLKDRGQTNVICVLSMLADKQAEVVAQSISQVCKQWICADSGGERGQTGATLARRVRSVLPNAEVRFFDSVDQAMNNAVAIAGEQDTILAFGSFSTVSAVMAWQENSMRQGRHDADRITPSARPT